MCRLCDDTLESYVSSRVVFNVFVVNTERLDTTRGAEGVFDTSGGQCGRNKKGNTL